MVPVLHESSKTTWGLRSSFESIAEPCFRRDQAEAITARESFKESAIGQLTRLVQHH
jgi:hypothetical protein